MPDRPSNRLEAEIRKAMGPQQFRLRRALRQLRKAKDPGPSTEGRLAHLVDEIARSVELRRRRAESVPSIVYDQSLPIHPRCSEIKSAIEENRVIIVCGETGSGKSTQLPKICLQAGRGVDGMIGHTQPRRLAAQSIAARLAEELAVPLGEAVGYKIRFSDKTGPETLIKLMTDGMLLAEISGDRFLNQYDTIILDEAHERSLNIDFLLGYLKRLVQKRHDLRLIITSATIDAERFSAHFPTADRPAPILTVSGRGYPVEIRYRHEPDSDDAEDPDTARQVVAAVDTLMAERVGDILVFLPTERDIRDSAKALAGWVGNGRVACDVVPLYARLPGKEQRRVFEPHVRRRVVLATNVAESSLTVPGIRAVVDTGTARISRYSPRSKVQRLPVESISRASADQRAGRCGRVGPGICLRLYSPDDYAARDSYTTPEIRRTNLASVILQTMALKLGAIDDFPFLDPPAPEAIRDGYKTLYELGAVDRNRQITELGRQLSRLPVDPRIGRMILAAAEERCLEEVLIIAAGLEVRDPRERPAGKTEAADECHQQWADEHSDFFSLLKLWDFYHHLKSTLSRNQLRRACHKNFLSLNRLREWADIYRQLRQMATSDQASRAERVDDYDSVHRALLTGLLSGVAHRQDTYQYRGAGGNQLFLWPGSSLFSSPPKWVMAAELIETTRRYCRSVARIDPAWIEPLAGHLLSYSEFEPYWDQRSATPMVFQRVSLFGLTVVARRRVALGPLDPAAARQLFIQHGLVEGQIPNRFPFVQHNQEVRKELARRAARERRSDWIVGETAIYEFYDQRLPDDLFDTRRLGKWLRGQTKTGTQPLCMRIEDLVDPSKEHHSTGAFPDQLHAQSGQFPLHYAFSPGDEQDGVTVTVPQQAVNQISRGLLDWLVPGRLEEKVTALIRSLPKSLRRGLVPAPDTARRAVAELTFGQGDFLNALSHVLTRLGGEAVRPDDFQLDRLPHHLVMKIRLVDPQGNVLAVDQDLDQLRRKFAGEDTMAAGSIDDSEWNHPPTSKWDFGDLPEKVSIRRGTFQVHAFPAVVDQGRAVAVRLCDTLDRANHESRAGVRRLYYLNQRKSLMAHIKHWPKRSQAGLLAAVLPGPFELDTELALLITDRSFLGDEPLPRCDVEFRRRLDAAADRAAVAVQIVLPRALSILEANHRASIALEELPAARFPAAAEDVRRQLDELLPPRFLTDTPWNWLEQLPRFLRGIDQRLDKLQHGGFARDEMGLKQWMPFYEPFIQRRDDHRRRGQHDPELELFRWMLEEFRISLFAQSLGTSLTVSAKRLEKQWEKVAP